MRERKKERKRERERERERERVCVCGWVGGWVGVSITMMIMQRNIADKYSGGGDMCWRLIIIYFDTGRETADIVALVAISFHKNKVQS